MNFFNTIDLDKVDDERKEKRIVAERDYGGSVSTDDCGWGWNGVGV